MADPNTLIEAFDDGSIRFVPNSTKEDAAYTNTPEPDGYPAGARCGNCAHFIPGGACHVVQGRINPNAVCGAFYADVGIFADNKIGRDAISMVLGDTSTWTRADAERFIDHARREIVGR